VAGKLRIRKHPWLNRILPGRVSSRFSVRITIICNQLSRTNLVHEAPWADLRYMARNYLCRMSIELSV